MTALISSGKESTVRSGSRIVSVDEVRGLAMVLMAVFHFGYDLSLYGYVPFNSDALFWVSFRTVIVTLFFATVGISLVLANPDGIRWRAFWHREAKIAGGALLLTGVTFAAYPDAWIWFGVLHFIALASLLTLPLLYRPTLALIVGLTIVTLYYLTPWFNLHFLYQALNEPLNLPPRTLDLTRLIPWLGLVYLGVFLGHHRLFGFHAMPRLGINRPLQWLGRHALPFYLIHQIPLFALAWVIYQVHQQVL